MDKLISPSHFVCSIWTTLLTGYWSPHCIPVQSLYLRSADMNCTFYFLLISETPTRSKTHVHSRQLPALSMICAHCDHPLETLILCALWLFDGAGWLISSRVQRFERFLAIHGTFWLDKMYPCCGFHHLRLYACFMVRGRVEDGRIIG